MSRIYFQLKFQSDYLHVPKTQNSELNDFKYVSLSEVIALHRFKIKSCDLVQKPV